MRLVTTSDGTSVTSTGLRVLASANSPRMMRPPCFGCPPAAAVPNVGAMVGAGAAGLAALEVGCVAPAPLLELVVAAGADVGEDGCDAGPHAASTSMPAVSADTMRPLTAPVMKSIEGSPLG